MTYVFQKFPRNSSYALPGVYDISTDDSNWVMTSSFIIFTMQTGFGLLESGCVSIKNECNIMVKNMIDVVLGGFTYWLFGYGLSFGRGSFTNWFIALGDFVIDPNKDDPLNGYVFVAFIFQLSFSTTATTIVSGAMAERCNFKAYCLFSLMNTVIYSIPAGWVWGEHGFLSNLGAVDIAGSGPVHLIGGSMAFASAIMLGPRLGRYANGLAPLPMGNPVNACMGLFVLWWGWLAFNAGSTYGMADSKWIYSARAAVMTMLASFGGGFFSIVYTMIKNVGRVDILDVINSILCALVSITAGCFLYSAWDAIIIGIVGAMIVCFLGSIFDKIGVDDPVGASCVHGIGGIWGVVAVGLFAEDPIPLGTTSGKIGLFKGGGWYLLGIQSFTALVLALWGFFGTCVLLWLVDKLTPLRMDPIDEILGTDLTEHKIHHRRIGVTKALEAFKDIDVDLKELRECPWIGTNPIQDKLIEKIHDYNFLYKNALNFAHHHKNDKFVLCPRCKKDLRYSDILKRHLKNCDGDPETKGFSLSKFKDSLKCCGQKRLFNNQVKSIGHSRNFRI